MKTWKKIVSSLMVFFMVISLGVGFGKTTPVYAAEGDDDGFVTSKTTVLQDDGTYTITLEAYATGEEIRTTTTEHVANDVVLVLDVSGSMKDEIKFGDTKNLDQLNKNAAEGAYYFKMAGVLSYDMRYNAGTGKWQYDPLIGSWRNLDGNIFSDLILNGRGIYIKKIDALKASATTFINEVNADAVENDVDHNISIVKYAGDYQSSNHLTEGNHSGKTELVKNFLSAKTDNATLISAINGLAQNGATSADYGMTIAKEVLDQASYKDNGHGKVVVMLTDGEPNHSSGFNNTVANATIAKSKEIKDGHDATVYTIGFYDASFTETTAMSNYMNNVSSNYPNAVSLTNSGAKASDHYYMKAQNSSGLDEIFKTIAKDTISGGAAITADSTTVVKDIISNEFVAPEGATTVTTKVVDHATGAETDGPAATIDGATIKVTGFDFAENWWGQDAYGNNRGKKLKITIEGILPADGAFTGAEVATNATGSGVFAEDEIAEIEEFEKPTVVLNNNVVVVDYAKKLTVATGVSKFLVDGAMTTTAPEATYGTVAKEGTDVTFTPNSTSWTGSDAIYTFDTDWTKTTVKAANNVYYEDTFNGTGANDAVSISYTGTWTKGTADDNAGSNIADGVNGWIDDVAAENAYTDGSAATTSAKGATATINFTGTGIDVYTKTTSTSGAVIAKLSAADESVTMKTKLLKIYNESKSGTYYSVPTLSFNDLAYGNYKLTIMVTADTTTGSNYDYCIDGIRIYNPSSESTPAKFVNINTIIEGNVFVDETGAVTSVTDAAALEGAQDGNTGLGAIAKNEVYLSKGATVSFSVPAADEYYIGMKSLTGAAVTAEFTKGSAVKSVANITHTGDLYYKVVPQDGVITIKNAGDNVLALTKLQMIGAADTAMVSVLSDEGAVTAAARFASYAPEAYSVAPVTEEVVLEEDSQEVIEAVQPDVTITEAAKDAVEPEEMVIDSNIITKLLNGFKKLLGRR